VQYAEGRINLVDLHEADLAEVLDEITRPAKLRVRGTLTAQRLHDPSARVPFRWRCLVRDYSRGQSFVLTSRRPTRVDLKRLSAFPSDRRRH
jgi:hypothetical protein